jgi:lipoic acid synthetase
MPSSNNTLAPNATRMPVWIRQNLGSDARFGETSLAVRDNRLHTVCEEARCPNRGECWSRGTATFMLLGDTCTRACGFCAVKTGKPTWFDADEARRMAAAVAGMRLKYVVLTSVNRDDLDDGGASVFADALRLLRQQDEAIGVEFLTPDFRNCRDNAAALVQATLAALPKNSRRDLVWGHNVETVPRLYQTARKGSKYERSLDLLHAAARVPGVQAKSALMLGLGETREEVLDVLRDLYACGVVRVSLGQYLRPSLQNLPVLEYVHPDVFAAYEHAAREIGFEWVKAGPLVRSSYFAEEQQSSQGKQLTC